jgi:hypothetical protein
MNSGSDWLQRAFSQIYPKHVNAFTRLLVVLRRDFDGDLDLLLVLAAIADKWHLADPEPEALQYETLGATPPRAIHMATINTYSVSHFTGIPRETVRRKVDVLIRRGWLTRDETGSLLPTQQVANDLKESTNATLTYIRAIISACDTARGIAK